MNTTKFFSYVLVHCALLMSVLVPVDPASAATADVSVVNNDFVPGTVTISTGDSVTWTWAASTGGVPHNTRSDSGLWDSGIHPQPFTFTQQFSSTGTFPYHCDVHPGMNGSVVVQSGPLPEVPTITGQPQNQTVAAGGTVTFTVQATGTEPLSYQWQLNGTDIPGANTSSLTLNNVTDANAGTYVVVVSNSAGSTTSSGAVLTVTPGGGGAPAITTQPQSQTIQAGNGVTFNVQASGTEPLGYQWRFNGTDIPGATGNSLTLDNVDASDAGTYSVVVSNASGSITSADAVLTVTPAGGQQYNILQELKFKLTGYYQLDPTEDSDEIRLHAGKVSITNREILDLLQLQLNLIFTDDAKLLLVTSWPVTDGVIPAVVVRDTVGGDTVDTDVTTYFGAQSQIRVEDGKINKNNLKASGTSYDVIEFEMKNVAAALFRLQCYGKTKIKTVNFDGNPVGYSHTGKLNASGSGDYAAAPGQPLTRLALTGTVEVKDHDVEQVP